MTDIVERLRDGVNRHYGKDPAGLLNEAADEIERLREENKQLREKLSKTTYSDNFPVTEEDL